MIRFSLSGLRVRVFLLVLTAVLPALGLVFYTALEQKRSATVEVQETALRLARLASSNQGQLIGGGCASSWSAYPSCLRFATEMPLPAAPFSPNSFSNTPSMQTLAWREPTGRSSAAPCRWLPRSTSPIGPIFSAPSRRALLPSATIRSAGSPARRR